MRWTMILAHATRARMEAAARGVSVSGLILRQKKASQWSLFPTTPCSPTPAAAGQDTQELCVRRTSMSASHRPATMAAPAIIWWGISPAPVQKVSPARPVRGMSMNAFPIPARTGRCARISQAVSTVSVNPALQVLHTQESHFMFDLKATRVRLGKKHAGTRTHARIKTPTILESHRWL